MFSFGGAASAGQPAPPPPPPQDLPGPPPPPQAPLGGWAFTVCLAGRRAVRPVNPNGTRPSKAAETPSASAVAAEDNEGAAEAAIATMWVMVLKLDGTTSWWRLRADYTINGVLDAPPEDATPTWYGWETPDRDHFFQHAGTGEVTWTWPGNTWPGPAQTGEQWIRPGSAIRIVHSPLVTPCKHLEKYNGVQGVVHSCDGGDGAPRMAYILLPSELGDHVPQVPADWLQPLAAGNVVTLRWLEAGHLQHLNGTDASICDSSLVNGDEMRVSVAGGTEILVRIDQMEPLPRISNLDLKASTAHLRWRKEQICNFVDDFGTTYKFSVHLPCGFSERLEEANRRGESARPWPLLFHMHGRGGQSMFLHTKKAINTEGFQLAAKEFVVVSPHATWDWIHQPAPWAAQLFRHVRAASWIDPNRCYISGCSMGGMGTWELAAQVKDAVAAIAPVAAHHDVGRTEYLAEELKNVPILALSSESDGCCSLTAEMALWQQLMARGNEQIVGATVPHVSHCDMFDAAYCQDTALYEWLLAHSLTCDRRRL